MKLRALIFVMLAVVAALVLAACQPIQDTRTAGSEEITLYVGPEQVDCVGVAPQKCLLVKENPEEEYTYFYSEIEGFTFEPGYEYQLLVLVEPVENAPADASSLKYTLIEEVSKTPVGEQSAAPELEGVTWQLESYLNSQGEMSTVLPETTITAIFEGGNVSGSAGCNNYFASYTVDGSSLTIEPGGSTMMACAEPIMQQEADYLSALATAASYQIVDGMLEITNAEGATILVFSEQQPPSLSGATWIATGVNNGKGAVSSLIIGSEITALFGEDGSLSGSAGCNNYTTSYEVTGDAISIGPAATTRMMCATPEGVMEQEMAYLTALVNSSTHTLSGDRLELRAADGALQVSYSVMP
jgi:heat shock protein HslJ